MEGLEANILKLQIQGKRTDCYLGMPFATSAGVEKINLNVDSLWSGGPFQSSVSPSIAKLEMRMSRQKQEYTGGNPISSVSRDLTGIRKWIFQNGTGSR